MKLNRHQPNAPRKSSMVQRGRISRQNNAHRCADIFSLNPIWLKPSGVRVIPYCTLHIIPRPDILAQTFSEKTPELISSVLLRGKLGLDHCRKFRFHIVKNVLSRGSRRCMQGLLFFEVWLGSGKVCCLSVFERKPRIFCCFDCLLSLFQRRESLLRKVNWS